MEKLINNVNSRSIVLQVDFSENATLECQNEIQPVQWQSQSALFIPQHTQEIESVVSISDDLQHTKLAMYTFMSKIYPMLRGKHRDFDKIDIFLHMVLVVNLSTGFSSNLHLMEKSSIIVNCNGIFLQHHMGRYH